MVFRTIGKLTVLSVVFAAGAACGWVAAGRFAARATTPTGGDPPPPTDVRVADWVRRLTAHRKDLADRRDVVYRELERNAVARNILAGRTGAAAEEQAAALEADRLKAEMDRLTAADAEALRLLEDLQAAPADDGAVMDPALRRSVQAFLVRRQLGPEPPAR